MWILKRTDVVLIQNITPFFIKLNYGKFRYLYRYISLVNLFLFTHLSCTLKSVTVQPGIRFNGLGFWTSITFKTLIRYAYTKNQKEIPNIQLNSSTSLPTLKLLLRHHFFQINISYCKNCSTLNQSTLLLIRNTETLQWHAGIIITNIPRKLLLVL